MDGSFLELVNSASRYSIGMDNFLIHRLVDHFFVSYFERFSNSLKSRFTHLYHGMHLESYIFSISLVIGLHGG